MRTIFATTLIAALANALADERSAECNAYVDALVEYSTDRNGVWDQETLIWTDNFGETPEQFPLSVIIANGKEADENFPAYTQAMIDEKCMEGVADFPAAVVEKANIKSS